jgi:DeoR family transcriptional regulator, fructose operon transcriptional repressor
LLDRSFPGVYVLLRFTITFQNLEIMNLNERQLEIIRIVQRLKQVEVHDLSSRFATSLVTIRKDLDVLQERGILQRTHGGAILAEDIEKTIPIGQKLGSQVRAKEALAQTAKNLIFDCRTVALDAGSTTLSVARQLKKCDLLVVTNSLLIAREFSSCESGALVLLGGAWRKESSCFIGPQTLAMLDRLNIDIAFLGATGFSAEGGFTCQNSIEAQVKERILKRADRRFIVADSSKYKTKAFSTFASFNQVDGLIVDDGLCPEGRQELTDAGLHIIQAFQKNRTVKEKKS